MKNIIHVSIVLLLLQLCLPDHGIAQHTSGQFTGRILNKPERVEWFRDLGLGMFINWSVDSQLGSVISHSLVGATQKYADRFFQLPLGHSSYNP